MQEVYPNVFVGSARDFEELAKYKLDWKIIQACNDPYHRQAVGYKTYDAPKDSTEYLFAYRDNKLILNMADHNSYKLFSKKMIDEAIKFFRQALINHETIFIHCAFGMSRSASIAMLCLRICVQEFQGLSFEDMEREFKIIYPNYQPSQGIRDFIKVNWQAYVVDNFGL